jgi:hypothetical protein
MYSPQLLRPRRLRQFICAPPIGIDRSNYFVGRGVSAFWVLGYGRPIDVMGKYNAGTPTGTPKAAASTRGTGHYGISSASTNYWTVKTGPILGGLANWSIVVAGSNTQAGGTTGHFIYSERAASGNDIIQLGIRASTAGMTIAYRNDAGTLVQSPNTFGALNDNKNYIIGASKSTTAINQYVNGKNLGSALTWSTNDNFTDANVICHIGNVEQALTTSSWGGIINFVGLFPWTMSDQDQADFAADPFQFLIFSDDIVRMQVGPPASLIDRQQPIPITVQ